jgi:lipopolysaccharide export system protein LptA
MVNRKIYLFILLIVILVTPRVYAQDNHVATEEIVKKNESIEIVSDRLEAFNEKKLVIFTGNAIAKQGDRVLKADQLLLYYKKEPAENDKVGPMQIERTGELEKIEAKGNVSVTQGDKIATGDEGVYYHDTGQIILTGNALLKEGRNSIKGCRVIIYVNEKRGRAEVCDQEKKERVKAVLYPPEKKIEQNKQESLDNGKL